MAKSQLQREAERVFCSGVFVGSSRDPETGTRSADAVGDDSEGFERSVAVSGWPSDKTARAALLACLRALPDAKGTKAGRK